MNVELKSFQNTAVRELLKYIRHARDEARDGIAQALVFSAPTGSGKTVTITALMESIYQGHEITMGDPDAIFLWLSDSPELNQQSRAKILQQSSVFQESNLIVVEPPFSQEYFEAGKVYFLNTQKLAKDGRLTDTGDGREYSIWQTIQNTANAKPDHFYVIIDEAHRGM
ncbi:MAG: DEAD/DEAH box helicase family protein, partial [Nitrososphaera sp.]